MLKDLFSLLTIIALLFSSCSKSDEEEKGDEQFEISDGRSVDEIYQMIEDNGMQPVMTDYIYV